MNFGEKLTKLRKQKGLSQEELGYELNVTRQTISKWELGQTTPEMDKLVEMSKVFGVTVDELISQEETINNETQSIEDRPISDKQKNNSTWKVILLIVAIFVIGGMIVYGFVFSKVLNFGKDVFDESRKIREQAKETINIISGEVEQQMENNENSSEKFNQIKQNVLESIDEAENEISGTEENIKVNQEKITEKQSTTNKFNNEKTEEQISEEQREWFEQAQQEQQQMQQRYEQQEKLVNEQMEKAKEQMSSEQREWFEQAQKEQQQLLQQYQ